MDKGGNAALMAPEVVMARPGTFSTISYERLVGAVCGRGGYCTLTRSDLWTAGTLAYQIFGGENPFIGQVSSRTYSSTMLPPLPDNTPWLVSMLVSSMLSRNPGDRPTPR